jgi:hypothetical protein
LVDADPTLEEAEVAIRRGAGGRGWKIEKEAPGVLVGAGQDIATPVKRK